MSRVASHNVVQVGWFKGNSENRTHDVGIKTANKLGLYDTSGNFYTTRKKGKPASTRLT
jgi:formylglycine-generating enzyme required for sulfatase activity